MGRLFITIFLSPDDLRSFKNFVSLNKYLKVLPTGEDLGGAGLLTILLLTLLIGKLRLESAMADIQMLQTVAQIVFDIIK